MQQTAILLLSAIYITGLLIERARAARERKKIPHVVHVNGTRGKSTVSRLIAAGLRAGGIKVCCKTTGTDPMILHADGSEERIHRRGKANIKEQIATLLTAAREGSEVLVIECMAVQPEYQRTCQRDILRADIGVITNVRRDHTDVMGERLEDICDALSNTIPDGGVLFTAENNMSERLKRAAELKKCDFFQILPSSDLPDFDFPENIALALAVCQKLGVERETALNGMRHYCRDPYALSAYRWHGGLFFNGMSINDMQSTCMIWAMLKEKYRLEDKRLILLVNNRADRGSRTQDMLSVCSALQPEEIWLLGAARSYAAHRLERALPETMIYKFRSARELPADRMGEQCAVYAVGNIAQDGREVMARIQKEGEELVS